jgi:2-acylglycerol O-acyltransferase 1
MNANGAATSLFPQLNFFLLARDSLFWLPLMREFALLTGYRSCSKKSCISHLTTEGHDGRGSGNAIIIAVGGQREASLAKPGAMELVLAKRKGFVKVAIETGADLVPVIGFGENEIWGLARVIGFITGVFGSYCLSTFQLML